MAEWEDLPMQSSLAGLPNSAFALGGTDADIDSYELAVTAQINEAVKLTYAGSYTDTEVTRIPDPSTVTTWPGAIAVGGKLYNYSPTTHSVTLDYRADVGQGWEGYASTTYAYREKIDAFSSLSSVMDTCCYKTAPDDYKMLNISAGIANGAWDVNLSVTNATDFDGMTGMVFSDAQNDGELPMPRAFHIQVTYSNF